MQLGSCGIYKITNTINGDYYIGSSTNIRKRFWRHRYDLAKNQHFNVYLQRAYNKYGKQAFEFTTILLCDIEHKLYFEQGFLDLLKPAYNLAVSAKAPMQGLRSSDETKRKISEALMDHKISEETKRKIGKANAGELSANFGKHFSEEHRRKISESNKGELNYWFGKHHTVESRAKMSEAHQNISEETRRKLSDAHIGHKTTEKTRAKLSKALKGRAPWNKGLYKTAGEAAVCNSN